jgi:hypothetical protein
MATDPVEILNQRNAEVAQIRGYVDLTEEAKERRIAEVNERAQAQYTEAREAAERERTERLQRTKKAVFRVPVGNVPSDAEAAQIHAAFRGAFSEVLSATASPESPHQAQEKLEEIMDQAERTGDTLLARAAYHRAIDLGIQGIVDAYLATRPQEERAWEAYTTAYREVDESRGVGHILERGLAERALSSDPASGIGG